jgi:hypothetical protein
MNRTLFWSVTLVAALVAYFWGGLHARECRLPTVARLSPPVSHEVEKG